MVLTKLHIVAILFVVSSCVIHGSKGEIVSFRLTPKTVRTLRKNYFCLFCPI
jgi:hypothetical protein